MDKATELLIKLLECVDNPFFDTCHGETSCLFCSNYYPDHDGDCPWCEIEEFVKLRTGDFGTDYKEGKRNE